MKAQLHAMLTTAIDTVARDLDFPAPAAADIELQRSRDAAHGEFACNIAMRLARTARRKPRDIAERIVASLPANRLLARAEVAGAGFINLFLSSVAWSDELAAILSQGEAYGRSTSASGRRVLLEFVSANPTGPLHVGHGRHAAYGATLANLLAATGHDVHREFYVNDAGRQIDILAASCWVRCLQAAGIDLAMPANGYQGDYLLPLAGQITAAFGARLHRPLADIAAGLPPDAPTGDKEAYIDALIGRARALLGDELFDEMAMFASDGMVADIRADLEAFGVQFDRWFSERSLSTGGAIDRAIARLRRQGNVYERDGALWFRASAFGDDEDRVVVRENGVTTYFASDIAYHLDKRERGFDLLIDVLGADHHGYVARVRGGLEAMGEPPACLEVCLLQLVNLFRAGQKLAMGKREGNFITLRQLREEVGNDACRFFYVMRGHEQHLDFDLELAKARNNDNPVYYIQYAYARIASVYRQLAVRGLGYDEAAGLAAAGELRGSHEVELMRTLSRYPEIIEQAAAQRSPHTLAHYLRDLAQAFHTFYNAEQVLIEDSALRNARLAMLAALRHVIVNGARILGIGTPESM
ncbi:MAG: arginine--tRNA ligase [Steroidobacteraceae bacterium]